MDERFRSIAALAAANHSVVSTGDLDAAGIGPSLRYQWVKSARLVQLGVHSYALGGSAHTWHRDLAAGLADLGSHGFIAGRAGAKLQLLDGFGEDALEFIVPRHHRGRTTSGMVAATEVPIGRIDIIRIDGLAVLRAERLILDAPLFNFSRTETENAIDSAIRLRLVSEPRIRAKVIERHRSGVNHGRILFDALVDTGGESALERMFLALTRRAGLERPEPQRTYRDGGRVIARVDFRFSSGLLVEVAGFERHSSRSDSQRDAQRQTELTLRGRPFIIFTYDDVRYRPAWVAKQLRLALQVAA